MTNYNITDLDPSSAFEKHIFHRDQFAHYLRWSYVLKSAKPGQKILDFGCGKGNLLEVFYRNKYIPAKYLGLDIRKQSINKSNEKWKKLDFASFQQEDLCGEIDIGTDWDIVTSFEVIEHIGKHNADSFLTNLVKCCNENTVVLISIPCYDEKVGAAANHIIDGEVGEFKFNELKQILEKYFDIENVYGTFASQKDYKQYMNDWQKKMFNELKEYYDSNLVSVLMAPFFPERSRNCLWRLRKKGTVTNKNQTNILEYR